MASGLKRSRTGLQLPNRKDRSNEADGSGTDVQARELRSGEGSESALRKLKHIERDRQRTKPKDDSGSPT